MIEFEHSLYTHLLYIPAGHLTTYGQLSKLAGYPNHARYVGKLLSRLPKDTKLPWFRVINGQGKISLRGEAFIRQKELLEREGIKVSDTGQIEGFKKLLVD
jgi:methylated-DNA-protein-cysteine methyltransferase-like protein